jgi:hypothetical protein
MEGLLRGEIGGLSERLASEIESLRTMSNQSTETVANHVDNAVLVLAEALLRRPVTSTPESAPELAGDAQQAPEQTAPEIVEADESGVADVGAPDELTPASAPLPPAAVVPAQADPLSDRLDDVEDVEDLVAWSPADEPADDSSRDAEPAEGSAHQMSDDGAVAAAEDMGDAAPAYDDVLDELPVTDDGPIFPQFEQAPYDLERALFGDRSRVFVAADVPKADEVDVESGSPPVDDAPEDEPTEVTGVDDELEAGDDDRVDDERKGPVYTSTAEFDDDDENDDDEHDQPRRRPWWRPST